jgi:putative Mg2+ transporter-C (MgtC) family protein
MSRFIGASVPVQRKFNILRIAGWEAFMQELIGALTSVELNMYNVAARILLSLVLGGVIGIEREKHKQLAGFRTHILIAVSSTLLMLLSIYVPQAYSSLGASDPGRIAAQVVSGIGFIGAGAILRIGANVRGLTTAATIWSVAAVGLVVGAGMYFESLAGTAVILFVLTVLDKIEKEFFPSQHLKYMHITFEDITAKTDLVLDIIRVYKIKIKDFDINQSPQKNTTKMTILVQVKADTDFKRLYDDLQKVEGVVNIRLDSAK